MPIMACQMEDKSGYKYGAEGHCYPYKSGDERSRKAAKRKAMLQGAAIEASKARASGGKNYSVKEFGDSLNDFIERVRMAFDKRFGASPGDMMAPTCWIMDTFQDHIIAKEDDHYYRVGMDVEGEYVAFDDREDWEPVKLDYVNEMAREISYWDVHVAEFRGNFPDVPIAAGVNVEELKALDSDPMFVTLPIVPSVGTVSHNGLLYDEALVDSIVAQINDKRPGGLFGHIRETDRGSAFPLPEALWVGAMRQGETAWAKAYIRPGAARDYMRHLKAVGGEIATSIYGKGKPQPVRDGVRRMDPFRLETLDFAPPERAALGHSARPWVTAEMTEDDTPPNDGGNPPAQGDGVPARQGDDYEEQNEMTKDELIAELTVGDIPQALREQIIAATAPPVPAPGQDPRDQTITELQQRVQEFADRRFTDALSATVAELTAWEIKGDSAKATLNTFRRTVRDALLAAVGSERNEEKLAEVVEQVWESLKPLAETVRLTLTGPAVTVGERRRGPTNRWDDTPENRQRAIRETGISVGSGY